MAQWLEGVEEEKEEAEEPGGSFRREGGGKWSGADNRGEADDGTKA